LIKGNERRIVVVEKLSHPLFERAVFYVRVGAATGKSEQILSQKAQELWENLRIDEALPVAEQSPSVSEENRKHRFPWRKKGKNSV